MTIHKSKGLEFPVDFLPALHEDVMPHRRSVADGEEAIEEERRLLYVALTRAKQRLFLANSRSPTRFLRHISSGSFLVRR